MSKYSKENLSQLYKAVRMNKILENRKFSKKEIAEISQAHFYYVYENINMVGNIDICTFINFSELNLKKISMKMLDIEKKLKPIFKNQKNTFEKTVLYIMLNLLPVSKKTKLTKL